MAQLVARKIPDLKAEGSSPSGVNSIYYLFFI